MACGHTIMDMMTCWFAAPGGHLRSAIRGRLQMALDN
jgi:hypothetical protein